MRHGGYLVLNGHREPMVLSVYDGSCPVLTNGREATIFTSYEQARCAVRRTHRYAHRHDLDWGKLTARTIMRVIVVQP